jgi:hypothetical protein
VPVTAQTEELSALIARREAMQHTPAAPETVMVPVMAEKTVT